MMNLVLLTSLLVSWSVTAHSAPAYEIFEECDPTGIESGINNFTICGFKASPNVNLVTVDGVHSGYTSVSALQGNDYSHSA